MRVPVGSISRAAASAFEALRPLMTTEPPSATNRVATSLPMPEPPPVTIAILSWKRMISLRGCIYLSIGLCATNSSGYSGRQGLSIGRQRGLAVNETAERLMDLAESHMRNAGYGGFSFRDLAAEIGIKSASVHHHFPTKATMAAAVARRYADR